MQKKRSTAAMLVCLSILILLFSACTQKQEPSATLAVKNLTWAVGTPLPLPSDFVSELPQDCTVRFASEYTYSNLGSYTVQLILTDADGRESTHFAGFTLVLDEEPPQIHGVNDLSVTLNGGLSYRSGITVTDNCDGKVTLEVDSSLVDTTKEGAYPVTYTATDAAGKKTVKQVTVYVYREEVTEAMLYAEVDRLIDSEISKNASKERMARDVFEYVYYHVDYVSDSDKSDWVRAAYDGIRTGRGDCFTYFALSKAFFNRLGIQTMDIQRTEGIVEERHYWNYVNIGSAEAPEWYHFDACRIKDITGWGCLVTDAQLAVFNSYRTDENGVSEYFYAYNASAYPKSAEIVISPSGRFDP